jgi:aminoglycoside phosphotransferase (APT) family kinase protein
VSSTAPSPPPAEGKRLPWSAIPAGLRAALEQQLGGRVAEAVTQPGGFSPGVAARLLLDNGRRAFVKAVGDVNPESPDIHRAEARIAAALPAGTPAPRLLGCIDTSGWVILLFEDIDGKLPAQPWLAAELDRVLDAMTDLATALTPAPIDAPCMATRIASLGTGWRQLAQALAADPAVAADDPAVPADDRAALAMVEPWATRHLDQLVAVESGWAAAVSGDSLVHADIRADNILLTADRVVFVDWPWACRAAPWVDLVGMLPSVAMQAGPPPEQIVARHPVAAGADPDAITAAVAALAGYFVWQGRQPDPPGLPTVRAFQRAQGEVALDWLRTRTGWR